MNWNGDWKNVIMDRLVFCDALFSLWRHLRRCLSCHNALTSQFHIPRHSKSTLGYNIRALKLSIHIFLFYNLKWAELRFFVHTIELVIPPTNINFRTGCHELVTVRSGCSKIYTFIIITLIKVLCNLHILSNRKYYRKIVFPYQNVSLS